MRNTSHSSSHRVIGKTQCPKCAQRGKDKHGDNLILYGDGGGAFCFSCGYFESETLGNRIRTKREQNTDTVGEAPRKPLNLPEDIELLPRTSPGYLWLSQYLDKIPADMLWSTKQQWLIFPYFMEGQLVAWQARDFSGKRKWLTFGKPSELLYVLSKKQENSHLYLVEDIVSAMKIRDNGGTASPLFGARVGLKRFMFLASKYKAITLWLDPDKRRESVAEVQAATRIGIDARVQFSDLDPKELRNDELQKILSS
jgi:hypothetical protein